jgi:hypothetical protein
LTESEFFFSASLIASPLLIYYRRLTVPATRMPAAALDVLVQRGHSRIRGG